MLFGIDEGIDMGDGDDTARSLSAASFGGRMPARSGDISVETHGITPIPESNRYGSARRLFTVWFAPNVNMTGVFSGTLAIVLGLGFWLGLLAMVIGTVIGSLPVAYLSTWGPRTGTGQLPLSRLAFGDGVVLPGVVQWLSSIAWDALVGLFGGEALSTLLHIPFVIGVALVLVLQCLVGIFGYELIHRVEAVMTVVLAVTFAVLTIKLVSGHQVITASTVHGKDLAGAFVLEVTIALSLAISWASYASDYSRYLPAATSRKKVFWYTLAGIAISYVAIQAIGIAAAGALSNQTAAGVRNILGGGVLGVVGLLAIGLAAVGSNAMNDYSGSLALQTVGIRLKRPVAASVVTVIAFLLILWMHHGDLASKFENVLLFIGYWIPGFVAIVAVDWRVRSRGRATVDPLREHTSRRQAIIAVVTFLIGFGAAVPFMDTSLFVGAAAKWLHGADLAYFVGFIVTGALYAPLRLRGTRSVTAGAPRPAASAQPEQAQTQQAQ
jgi:NCS1 family nucleobase:cation symporter-1